MSNVIPLEPPHVLRCWRCGSTEGLAIYIVAQADPETFLATHTVVDATNSAQLCPRCFEVLSIAWNALLEAMTPGEQR
jgi:hypothetical protein